MKFLTLTIALAYLTSTIAAQGIPGTGEKPCCGCSVRDGGVVCRDHPDGDLCITQPVKCAFDEAEDEYCCCCRPGDDPAIVCTTQPKGDGCICPAVVCDIPWEPEWAESWIPWF